MKYEVADDNNLWQLFLFAHQRDFLIGDKNGKLMFCWWSDTFQINYYSTQYMAWTRYNDEVRIISMYLPVEDWENIVTDRQIITCTRSPETYLIRVIFEGHLSVSFLYLLICSTFSDPQYFVVILSHVSKHFLVAVISQYSGGELWLVVSRDSFLYCLASYQFHIIYLDLHNLRPPGSYCFWWVPMFVFIWKIR